MVHIYGPTVMSLGKLQNPRTSYLFSFGISKHTELDEKYLYKDKTLF